MKQQHLTCPFPELPHSQQVWCDECRKWTDPQERTRPSRTISFQPYDGTSVLITEREVIGLKHGAKSSRRVWNEQRVIVEPSDFPKLIAALQKVTPV